MAHNRIVCRIILYFKHCQTARIVGSPIPEAQRQPSSPQVWPRSLNLNSQSNKAHSCSFLKTNVQFDLAKHRRFYLHFTKASFMGLQEVKTGELIFRDNYIWFLYLSSIISERWSIYLVSNMWSGGQAEGSQRFMALFLNLTPCEHAVHSSEVQTIKKNTSEMYDCIN